MALHQTTNHQPYRTCQLVNCPLNQKIILKSISTAPKNSNWKPKRNNRNRSNLSRAETSRRTQIRALESCSRRQIRPGQGRHPDSGSRNGPGPAHGYTDCQRIGAGPAGAAAATAPAATDATAAADATATATSATESGIGGAGGSS